MRKSAGKFTVPVESTLPEFAKRMRISGSVYHDMKATNEKDLQVIRETIILSFHHQATFDWDMNLVLKACGGKVEVCPLASRVKTSFKTIESLYQHTYVDENLKNYIPEPKPTAVKLSKEQSF